MKEEADKPKTIPEETLVPMKPHSYPFWVLFILSFSVLSFLYATPMIFKMFSAAIDLKKGEVLLENHDYDNAMTAYLTVLREYPYSKSARVNYAICAFSNDNPSDDDSAISALEGLKIVQKDWKRILKVMPDKYKNEIPKGEAK